MLLKTLALITGIGGVLASSSEKFFRRDYIYIEDYNAFYKVHWADNSRTWGDGFITCDNEGAKLFYPEHLNEWMVAANLTESLTDVEGIHIFVGARDEFGLGDFVSVEGLLVPELSSYSANREGGESKCVVMSVRTGSYTIGSCKQKRAFICKRVDDETCPTVDSAYMYSTATKKCYKVNKRPKIWSEAHHTCLMEGGILATPKENIDSTLLSQFMDYEQLYFIGARRIDSHGSFYNVQGLMYELSEEERNEDKNCKVLSLNNRSNNYSTSNNKHNFEVKSYNCNTTLPFICEMKVKV